MSPPSRDWNAVSDMHAVLSDLGDPSLSNGRNGRDLAEAAERLGYEYVDDLSAYPIDPSARELVPHGMIRRHRAVPIGFSGQILVVAVADPANVIALDDIRA